MRRFAVGDIHGQGDAFESVLQQVDFDDSRDQLIVLGDIYDYGTQTCQIIDRILKIKNRVVIRGNHDEVFRHWALTGNHMYNWSHGGSGTLKSYSQYLEQDFDFTYNMMHRVHVPQKHINFLNAMKDYYITEDNIMFCHAGFDTDYSLEDQVSDEFYQNRSLFKQTKKGIAPRHDFKTVFIGHTITEDCEPFISDEVINLDTGAKSPKRPLTLMNIDTLNSVQSYLKNF